MSLRLSLGFAFASASFVAGCSAPASSTTTAGTLEAPSALRRTVDDGVCGCADAPSFNAAVASTAAPGSTNVLGTWKVADSDVTRAGFTGILLSSDGTFVEVGRTDGALASGVYTQPASIAAASTDGSSPTTSGPYLDLVSAPDADTEWVYGATKLDGDTLTMTLYAKRAGQSLDYTTPATIAMQQYHAPVPAGSWKVASDSAAAGFVTLVVNADGSWTETGRTDEEAMTGTFTQPSSVDVAPDYGSAPAGMEGPYVDLTNTPDGDGEWVYAWAESDDKTTLTLTLYAQRDGQGLRWATPTIIHLDSN